MAMCVVGILETENSVDLAGEMGLRHLQHKDELLKFVAFAL